MPHNRESLIAEKIALLQQSGYERVWFEDGRLCVEVNADSLAFDAEFPRLARRTWGPEWPIVRSAAWRGDIPLAEELKFTPAS